METVWNNDAKRYLRKISSRLNLPREMKKRILNDIKTSILARQEAGEFLSSILEDMGTPADVAAELNEQMKEFAYRKHPVRFAFLALCAFAVIFLLYDILVQMLLTWSIGEMASIGIIGGADGPTAIFITEAQTTGIPWEKVIPYCFLAAGAWGYWHFGYIRKKP